LTAVKGESVDEEHGTAVAVLPASELGRLHKTRAGYGL
jgi:hypothetical protein